MPNNEVMVEERAIPFNLIFLVKKKTARAAPPCAKTAGNSIGDIVS